MAFIMLSYVLCDGGGGSGWIVVSLVLVGDAAGENSISVLSDSPLIQYEPGNKPGDLEEEDAGQADGGVDTEGLETRHVLNK